MKKQVVKSERIVYIEKCPICKQEIKGFSESNVKWNLELHIEKKHNAPFKNKNRGSKGLREK